MDDDPIPISLVANYMFCPRRAWLEAVGEKVDSDQIMRGTYDHRKVDRTDGAPDADSYQAVNIRHEEWGVSGKLDAAKMTDSGIVIREYKATPVTHKFRISLIKHISHTPRYQNNHIYRKVHIKSCINPKFRC